MRNRTRFVVSCAVLLAAALAASAPLAAQARRQAAAARPAPARTADGHPDLSGMYDVATMTPLERPAGLGTRLVLTKEEAAALEQYEQQRQVKNDAPLAGDRGAPPVGGERTQ